MNVLLVNKFFRHGAGAETVVFDTLDLLSNAGHDVVPFAMAHENNEPSPWSRHFTRRRKIRGERHRLYCVKGAILEADFGD